MPRTKNRWRLKKTSSGTIIEKKAAAVKQLVTLAEGVRRAGDRPGCGGRTQNMDGSALAGTGGLAGGAGRNQNQRNNRALANRGGGWNGFENRGRVMAHVQTGVLSGGVKIKAPPDALR
jgi:hypothetical protein